MSQFFVFVSLLLGSFIFASSVIYSQALAAISVSAPTLVADQNKVPYTTILGKNERVIDAPIVTHQHNNIRYWFSSTYNTLAKFSGTLDDPFSKLLWSKPVSEVISNREAGASYWIVNTFSATTTPSPIAYSYQSGYSTVQGGNNWSYEYKTSSAYVPMTYETPPWGGTEKVWKGNEDYLLLGRSFFHTGANSDTSLAWKTPESGTITITGSVSDTDSSCGDGVIARVYKNSSIIWQENLLNGGSKTHSISESVTKGDIIRFVVNKNGNNFCDSTTWNPTITYTSTRVQ